MGIVTTEIECQEEYRTFQILTQTSIDMWVIYIEL